MSFKKITKIVGGSFLLFAVLVGARGSSSYEKKTPSPSPIVQSVTSEAEATTIPTSSFAPVVGTLTKVIKVIDGDTIEIEGGQQVRLIGIDTPETVDPNRPVGCYGKEASDYTKIQLTGKEVRLEKDVSETDKYGRLLRYVYLSDALFNTELVKEGYAQSSTYPPDVKYRNKFLAAQTEARNSEKGLWSATCVVTPKPATSAPKETTAPETSTTSGGTCKYSCSYPDQDCKNFSSHTEAQTFFNCCGFTATNDPMRLDTANGQGNGLACESL